MIKKFLLIIIAAMNLAHASMYHWSCSSEPGSHYFYHHGNKAGSKYYWTRGDGPGSLYFWNNGTGPGSKYFWINGTGPGSQYYVQRGDAAGSMYFWRQGSGVGSQYHWQTGVSGSVEPFYIPLCLQLRLSLPACSLIYTAETERMKYNCYSAPASIMNGFHSIMNSIKSPAIDCPETKAVSGQ